MRTINTEWIDRVLDHMIQAHRVTGQARPEHKRGWVSALHVLTEALTGEQMEVTTDNVTYKYVSASVLYLESLGMLSVTRAHGIAGHQGNAVESISLTYS